MVQKQTTPDFRSSVGKTTEQTGEERLPLLPGERILSSYAGRNGRFHATDKRLLFLARQIGGESFRDLSYSEITSVALELGGRSSSSIVMTVVFYIGAFIVFVLSQFIPANQVIHWLGGIEISPEAGRLIGLLLAAASALWGTYRLLDYLGGGARYILAGPGLLRDTRNAANWEIPVAEKDAADAEAFVQTVREQAVQRELNRQALVDMEARLTSLIAEIASRSAQASVQHEPTPSHNLPGNVPFAAQPFLPLFSRVPAYMKDEPRMDALEGPETIDADRASASKSYEEPQPVAEETKIEEQEAEATPVNEAPPTDVGVSATEPQTEPEQQVSERKEGGQ